MKSSQLKATRLDRRTEMRIRVPINLHLQGMAQPISAVNQDISWGGALFTIDEPLPREIAKILITLPWTRGEHIAIEATILRSRPLQNGQCLVAARFASLSPLSEARLEKLLNLLKASEHAEADGESSVLFQELDVIVNDVDEFRSILTQIAAGRYAATVFETYETNQSISLSIEGPRDLPAVRLRARVVEVHPSHSKEFEWADLYRLTLEFEHPRESLRLIADYLLSLLTDARSAAVAADSLGAREARQKIGNITRCAIESRFPEILNTLTAGWGDSEAFEVLFQDITLGDVGQSGDWPQEVWEELNLLQNVHDQAYGLSARRSSRLRATRSV